MMRELHVEKIRDAVKELCIDINYRLPVDGACALQEALQNETSPIGREVLTQLEENLRVADEEQIPICQDTGMAVVFLEIGQDVHLTGGDLEEAVHEGVRCGYEEGYLRKSVVGDPLLRKNTGDNTPAVIHTRIVPGERVKITVTAKGFGSENMSRVFMLKPAQGVDGVKAAVLETVREAGPNACPPLVVGVGIGGTFEKAALLAKEALLRPIETGDAASGEKGTSDAAAVEDAAAHIRALEKELLAEINALGIGPAGLGGNTTALAVHINTYATHIAGLPVAVNLCCHVDRHASMEL